MPSTTDITPFFGIFVAETSVTTGVYTLVAHAKKIIRSRMPTAIWSPPEADRGANYSTYVTTFFSEQHPPSWGKQSGLLETHHHYFTLGLCNGYIVVHCSDGDVKDILSESLFSANLGLTKITREHLNGTFLFDGEVRSLWLHGIHQRTGLKPDTKALTGPDLRLAIDPSSDQSYSYNATRSNVRLSKKERTVGVNLNDSYLWLFSLTSWKEFMDYCDALTELIGRTKALALSNPIETLSHPVHDINLPARAFDFSLIDLETIPSNSIGIRAGDALDRVLQDFTYEIDSPTLQDNVVRLKVHSKNNGLLFFLGYLDVSPQMVSGRITFSATKRLVQKNCSQKLDQFARVFNSPSLIRIWYETGHVIVGAACYELTYRNLPFTGFNWADFTNYNILKEKPLNANGHTDLASIGNVGEDSLFSWVLAAVKNPRKPSAYRDLNLATADDWLLCDDGAGEAADFIHATTVGQLHHLTYIHVKAANSSSSSRQIAVSAHDIVTTQAIKNLHLLNHSNFVTQITKRVSGNAQKKVWNGAIAGTTHGFINFIDQWKPSSVRVGVVIVQPHTLRSYYRRVTNTLQCQQLATLLNNAKHSAAGLNATFSVIGHR